MATQLDSLNLMPWYDLNDMPWLQQGADTGASLMKGAQLGSLISNGRYQAQQMQMEQQRFQSEQALMPLKQHMMENQVKGTALKLESDLNDLQYKLKQQESLANLSKSVQSLDYTDPSSFKSFLDYTSQNPWLMETPLYQHVVSNFGKSAQAKIAAEKLEALSTYQQNKLDLQAQQLAQQGDIAKMRDETQRTLKQSELDSKEKIAAERIEAELQMLERKAASKLGSNSPDYRTLMNKQAAIKSDKVLSTDEKLKRIDALRDQYKLDTGATGSDLEKENLLLKQQLERLIKKGYGGGASEAQTEAAPKSEVKAAEPAKDLKVRVMSPDGKTTGRIPISQLKDAVAKGYKPIQ